MCRLFAVHSTRPVSIAGPLETLSTLSRHHRDGWGQATHLGGDGWSVLRETGPAFESGRYSRLAGEPTGLVSLTHLRLASVGKLDLNNNHPFTSNGWAFMHNGTLRNFDQHRARLEAEIAPQFRAGLQGSTDSERCFALFLTFLQGRKDVEISEAARALGRMSHLVASMTDAPEAPSKMNFITSNGKITLAARRGHTMVMRQDESSVSIASESLTPHRWREVPEDGLLAVDDTLAQHESSVLHWR